MKAMKRIEESTCIRFHRIEPIPGKKWLLLMRTGRVEKTERTATTSTEDICYAEYLNENLKDKTYGDLGKVRVRMAKPMNTLSTFNLFFNVLHTKLPISFTTREQLLIPN